MRCGRRSAPASAHPPSSTTPKVKSQADTNCKGTGDPFSERSGKGNHKTAPHRLEIPVLEAAEVPTDGFSLRGAVLGRGGANIESLRQETGVRVRLAGRGVGRDDADPGRPRLVLESDQPNALARAKDLAEDLVRSVRDRHERHKRRNDEIKRREDDAARAVEEMRPRIQGRVLKAATARRAQLAEEIRTAIGAENWLGPGADGSAGLQAWMAGGGEKEGLGGAGVAGAVPDVAHVRAAIEGQLVREVEQATERKEERRKRRGDLWDTIRRSDRVLADTEPQASETVVTAQRAASDALRRRSPTGLRKAAEDFWEALAAGRARAKHPIVMKVRRDAKGAASHAKVSLIEMERDQKCEEAKIRRLEAASQRLSCEADRIARLQRELDCAMEVERATREGTSAELELAVECERKALAAGPARRPGRCCALFATGSCPFTTGECPRGSHARPEAPGATEVFGTITKAKLRLLQQKWRDAGGRGELVSAWQVRNPRLEFLFRGAEAHFVGLYGKLPDVIDAWHGSREDNLVSIAIHGFDPKRRSGQVYGAGEYFAKDPNVSVAYAGGGSFMFLCKMLLGEEGADHTWAAGPRYYVVKQREGLTQVMQWAA